MTVKSPFYFLSGQSKPVAGAGLLRSRPGSFSLTHLVSRGKT